MRPATRRRASAAVSRPVNVFCWEGWKQPSSGSGPPSPKVAPWPKRGRGRGAGRPRSARRRSAASQAKRAEADDHADVGADVELGAGPGQAGVALAGRADGSAAARTARRRRSTGRAAAARRRRGADDGRAGEAGAVQRGEEEVARPVAGEHPAGAVRAVGGRRQAEQQHARVRVAEARQRAAPVGLAGEGRPLLARDPLAPGDEPRAAPAGRDPGLEVGERGDPSRTGPGGRRGRPRRAHLRSRSDRARRARAGR